MSMQTLVGKKLVDISIIGKNEKAEEVFKSILLSFEDGNSLRIDPWDKEYVFSFLDERWGLAPQPVGFGLHVILGYPAA